MANKEIAVNISSLNGDIEELERTLNSLKKSTSDAYARIQELNGMWTGQANAAFNSQFVTDYASMQVICDNIKSLLDCMRYAKGEYTSCENSVSSIISAIKI